MPIGQGSLLSLFFLVILYILYSLPFYIVNGYGRFNLIDTYNKR
jgi:hypothetical protein